MSDWTDVLEVWTWTYYSAEANTHIGRIMHQNTHFEKNYPSHTPAHTLSASVVMTLFLPLALDLVPLKFMLTVIAILRPILGPDFVLTYHLVALLCVNLWTHALPINVCQLCDVNNLCMLSVYTARNTEST